jgi:ABC-type antimicrobial peptide transport system permease subunit
MAWIARLRALFHKDKLTREFDEELNFHLSMREQWNVEQGMPPAEAHRDARRRFGNPSIWRERMSEIDLMILPQTILQDLRYGARMLWRNAGFTIAAVLALAIGIGANTAAFTAYKAFFKRSLEARESGRMVNLALMLHSGSGDQAANPQAWFSIPDYEAYRDRVHSFSGLIATSFPQNLTLTEAGGVMSQRSASTGSLVGRLGLLPHGKNVETASTYLVSENYFSVLGVNALRGRTFDAIHTSELAASPSVLISENYWQKRFAGDPTVLGKTIRLNGVAFTVVGITPHNFVGTNVEAPDFWLPLSLEPLVHPDDNWLRNRENFCCRLYGRLASDASMDQALRQLLTESALLSLVSMLIRSSIRALQMDTGYDTKHVVSLGLQFPEGQKYSPDRQAALVRELRTRLAALPGVASITSARAPDGGDGLRTAGVSLNGEKPSPQNTRAILYYTYIQPNYFQTLGIPLLFGRGFQPQAGQPENAVILSESAAQLLWPGQSPIGHGLRLAPGGQFEMKGDLLSDGPTYEVIGVARDTRGVLLNGSDSEQIYMPMPEDPLQNHPILIRTQAAPAQIMNAIGPTISSVDPNLMAYASTLEEMLRQTESFIASSISATIASTIGMLGLLLASMGIFGTVSYIVVLRTREVGIRIALGAKKRDILGLMLRESTRPVLAGLLVGMTLAVGASYLLRGILYGVNIVDGISFVGVSLLFLVIALIATYLPSRRAMRVDPVVALRYE